MLKILNNAGYIFFYTVANHLLYQRLPVFNGKHKMNVYLCVGIWHLFLCDSYGAVLNFRFQLLPRLGSCGAS